eukprot:TRINITY_DN1311_c0_g1_i1.p1 TRINITY_DN1311_c0_g1~~TRINITY_DN1311_c0_g1_i1.p1  ORF type:complete len:389 (+),score=102.54 TRINITY_DN1311_c0_g1_i1:19-1185(+)
MTLSHTFQFIRLGLRQGDAVVRAGLLFLALPLFLLLSLFNAHLFALTRFAFGGPLRAAIFLSIWLSAVRKLANGGKCTIKKDLSGKVALVTGGNKGIGLKTAKNLSRLGCSIIIACRDLDSGRAALTDIQSSAPTSSLSPSSTVQKFELLQINLSSQQSIHTFISLFEKLNMRLDYLINNAGMGQTGTFRRTEDGFQEVFGTNYLGPFSLTLQLLPWIQKYNTKIVILSSLMHMECPDDLTVDEMLAVSEDPKHIWLQYSYSKLALLWFTRELQKRLQENGSKATVYAVHPGAVRTDIFNSIPFSFLTVMIRCLGWVLFKSPNQGCQTSLFCVLSDSAIPGGYHVDAHPTDPSPLGADDVKAKDLFQRSLKLLNLSPAFASSLPVSNN